MSATIKVAGGGNLVLDSLGAKCEHPGCGKPAAALPCDDCKERACSEHLAREGEDWLCQQCRDCDPLDQ